MEKKDVKYSKYCLVPHCQSSSIRTPEKMFLSLPVGSTAKLKKKRNLWLRAMRRRDTDISENTRGYVCEDHFNLEEDMENYLRFKLMGGKMYLKDHVVPHIFECQIDRKRHSPPESGTTKKARKALADMLLTETDEDEKQQLQPEVVLESSDKTTSVLEQILLSKFYVEDKCTQTAPVQRTVSVQYRPRRSKFVQTNIVILNKPPL